MNKVQLKGTIEHIYFDEFQGRVAGAYFKLEQEISIDNRNFRIERTKHWFQCVALGNNAKLLHEVDFKNNEIAIEGVLINMSLGEENLKNRTEVYVIHLLIIAK